MRTYIHLYVYIRNRYVMVNKIKWLLYFPDAISFVAYGWKFPSKSFFLTHSLQSVECLVQNRLLAKCESLKNTNTEQEQHNFIQCQNVGENQMAIIVFSHKWGTVCCGFSTWVLCHLNFHWNPARSPFALRGLLFQLGQEKSHQEHYHLFSSIVRCAEWLLV